jgi:hypothetical protein
MTRSWEDSDSTSILREYFRWREWLTKMITNLPGKFKCNFNNNTIYRFRMLNSLGSSRLIERKTRHRSIIITARSLDRSWLTENMMKTRSSTTFKSYKLWRKISKLQKTRMRYNLTTAIMRNTLAQLSDSITMCPLMATSCRARTLKSQTS